MLDHTMRGRGKLSGQVRIVNTRRLGAETLTGFARAC